MGTKDSINSIDDKERDGAIHTVSTSHDDDYWGTEERHKEYLSCGLVCVCLFVACACACRINALSRHQAVSDTQTHTLSSASLCFLHCHLWHPPFGIDGANKTLAITASPPSTPTLECQRVKERSI